MGISLSSKSAWPPRSDATSLVHRLMFDHGQIRVGQHRQGDVHLVTRPSHLDETLLIQGHLSLGVKAFLYGPAHPGRTLRIPSGWFSAYAKAQVASRSSGLAMLRLTSSQWPSPGSLRGRISTTAQSYSRGPLAPSPALHRSPSRLRQPAMSQSVSPHLKRPLVVQAHSWLTPLDGQHVGHGPGARSSHRLRLRSLPYTSSPVAQPNGTPDSTARSSISCASFPLVRKTTSSGTPASRRRSRSSTHT